MKYKRIVLSNTYLGKVLLLLTINTNSNLVHTRFTDTRTAGVTRVYNLLKRFILRAIACMPIFAACPTVGGRVGGRVLTAPSTQLQSIKLFGTRTVG